MKTEEGREEDDLAMAHSHDMRCHYIAIGDLAKEVGSQVAAVAAQIFCLASRRTVVVTRNGAGRIEHEVDSAIVRVQRRGNGREQNEEDKNLGNELHGGDESSVSPSGCQTLSHQTPGLALHDDGLRGDSIPLRHIVYVQLHEVAPA